MFGYSVSVPYAFYSETCGKHTHPAPHVAWGSFWAFFSFSFLFSLAFFLSICVSSSSCLSLNRCYCSTLPSLRLRSLYAHAPLSQVRSALALHVAQVDLFILHNPLKGKITRPQLGQGSCTPVRTHFLFVCVIVHSYMKSVVPCSPLFLSHTLMQNDTLGPGTKFFII